MGTSLSDVLVLMTKMRGVIEAVAGAGAGLLANYYCGEESRQQRNITEIFLGTKHIVTENFLSKIPICVEYFLGKNMKSVLIEKLLGNNVFSIEEDLGKKNINEYFLDMNEIATEYFLINNQFLSCLLPVKIRATKFIADEKSLVIKMFMPRLFSS